MYNIIICDFLLFIDYFFYYDCTFLLLSIKLRIKKIRGGCNIYEVIPEGQVTLVVQENHFCIQGKK